MAGFRRAFTLIELLVVVVIISILAALAVPNFLEAQTRSKVSRIKADLRTLAVGLDLYYLDNSSYPSTQFFNLPGACPDNWKHEDEVADPILNVQRRVLERISTPIAYLTRSFVPDVFGTQFVTHFDYETPDGLTSRLIDGKNMYLYQYMKFTSMSAASWPTYVLEGLQQADAFILISSGPNHAYPLLGGPFYFEIGPNEAASCAQFYDPTNGTVSFGAFFRVGGSTVDQNLPCGRFLELARRMTSR